jgi:hypothetical protein
VSGGQPVLPVQLPKRIHSVIEAERVGGLACPLAVPVTAAHLLTGAIGGWLSASRVCSRVIGCQVIPPHFENSPGK